MAEEAEEDEIDDTEAPSAISTEPFEPGPSELELSARARTAGGLGASSFKDFGERRNWERRDRATEWWGI